MKIINFLFLQWFFVRLTKNTLNIINKIEMFECSLTEAGYAVGGVIKEMHIQQWYSIQGFIIPLTGWINSFSYLNKPFFIRVTKKKIVK